MRAVLILSLLLGVQSSPVPDATTSKQWLITLNTTIFWPTSTDYFYGPTDGPEASVVSCNAEWIEYEARSTELWSLGPTATTTSFGSYPSSSGACRTSFSDERWSDTHTGPLTTLCDGAPRALGPRETATGYYPGTGPCSSFDVTYSERSSLYRSPSPMPTCTLEIEDCVGIWETYSSRSSAWRSSISTSTYGDTAKPIRPWSCPTPAREYPEENPCSACHFLPATATVFYWPVETADGDLCLQNGTTIEATPTAPPAANTAVVDGHTMESPSVYISFTSIYAWSNRRAHPGHQCGEYHSNELIAVHPTDVVSMRGHRNAKYPSIGEEYPFNFAEFAPQTLGEYTQTVVPWPQYRGGSQCPLPDGNTCTMVRDDYVPWMQLPEAVRQIDASWSVCHRSWYIPPVTLVPLIDGTASWTPAPPDPTDVEDVQLQAVPQPVGALATPTPTSEKGW
ncbi:hypothetical protein P170DRAFT_469099 [Aspergillus steynii IBT 23096]|uniref:Uncharacterized protein n=1 Tax=Aspergillus steynii IBT 23096 TaxID=1392250 RepID=A0A2I2GL63_9EURO|nr:uncharacterized protein P170DRAFT_469099 [Aspergillus steynii IBT 23096]PLB53611.1 hypothetical protein P170DRAFT_469099 [Aspergillus steynii IBT 23096]